jgi:hypothetical protein
MQQNNRDIASIWDITQAIQRIQTFTSGLTFDEYLNNMLIISAVERQFEVLGETDNSVSDEFSSKTYNAHSSQATGVLFLFEKVVNGMLAYTISYCPNFMYQMRLGQTHEYIPLAKGQQSNRRRDQHG